MKYKSLFILLSCISIYASNYASYSRRAQDCVNYINNTNIPLHVLIGRNAPFEEMIIDGIKMSTLESFRHFSIMMRIGSVVEAFREKCKNASNEEYKQARTNIRTLKNSFATIALLPSFISPLEYNETSHIKSHLETLSGILDHAAQYHTPTSTTVLLTSSNEELTDDSNTVPAIVPIAHHLDFIRENQLSKLCSYQKLSSGYSETEVPHSVANIMLLIHDPQIVQALQEKYRAASSDDRAKAVKSLTHCRERIAKSRTSINEVREFDSFIHALTSSSRLTFKKYLLIGSIITSGMFFVGYMLYNKYYNTTQSQSTTE